MNLLDEYKIRDILILEDKFNASIENGDTILQFINKLNTQDNEEKLSDETINLVKSLLKDDKGQPMGWESESIKYIYSEVFKYVSNGKLNVSNCLFLEKYIGRLNCILNRELTGVSDIPRIREEIKQYLEHKGYSGKFIFDFLIATAEAANNAIIHHGSGSYMLLERDNYIYSYIFDRGQGIDIKSLASCIFKRDFSTKSALGAGYKIILSKVDNLYIKYNNGVKILLEFEVK
jgi:anti-sigma regulatory factor (Ser/Thr protein kinase)